MFTDTPHMPCTEGVTCAGIMQECSYKVQERAYRGKKERTGKSKRMAVNRFKEADMWCRGDMCGGVIWRCWYMMRMGIRYPGLRCLLFEAFF